MTTVSTAATYKMHKNRAMCATGTRDKNQEKVTNKEIYQTALASQRQTADKVTHLSFLFRTFCTCYFDIMAHNFLRHYSITVNAKLFCAVTSHRKGKCESSVSETHWPWLNKWPTSLSLKRQFSWNNRGEKIDSSFREKVWMWSQKERKSFLKQKSALWAITERPSSESRSPSVTLQRRPTKLWSDL